jgi:centromere protein I
MRINLRDLTNHVSTIALSALTAHSSCASAILSYHIAMTSALSVAAHRAIETNKPLAVPLSMPSPPLFYLLLFTPQAALLSHVCSLLAQQKSLAASLRSSNTPIPSSFSSTLNSHLLDTGNLLWRQRAFASDNTARGCLLPAASVDALQAFAAMIDADASLAGLFMLSWHPVLSSLSHAAFVELENQNGGPEVSIRHVGPVSERSLVRLGSEGGVVLGWRDVRSWLLRWLREHGLGGVKELIQAAFKNAV